MADGNDKTKEIEKVKEDGAKAEGGTATGGGLEDDDVWGDVEDVSQRENWDYFKRSFINQKILNFLIL